MTNTIESETAAEKVDFQNPMKDCDLVMKGGLTSGIVYPATVLQLAKNYRFHSVGGTSAGAIAAALTAAAEAGRKSGGFEKLQTVAKEIAQSGFLLKIFKADGATQALMGLFISLLAHRPKKPGVLRRLWFFGPVVYGRLLYFFPIGFLVGAILGFLIFCGIAYLTSWLGHLLGEWWKTVPHAALDHSAALWGGVMLVGIMGLVVGSVLGAVAPIIYLFVRQLPDRNFFGICKGYIRGDSTVLTNWLHRKINELFGRSEKDDAITFDDLEKAGVKFKAISTNLAQNRPYIFPREPEGFRFVFNECELAQLFPPEVIRVLKKRPAETFRGPRLPNGFFYLPERGELPVLVATRMSLSFPILISAIPMYEVKPSAYQQKRDEKKPDEKDSDMQFDRNDLYKHWFSDGGICSNFPIGLFDVWLPKHPTFGINLNYLKSGQKIGSHVPRDNVPASEAARGGMINDVYMLQAGDHSRPQWILIDQLPTFLGSILDSARNYRDTLQSMLPSYSERIVQVWLDPEEGGMNLTMDKTKIDSLIDKGKTAGDLLAKMNFDAHRCMRLRVLLKVLCKEIENLHKGYSQLSDYEAIATAPNTWCGDEKEKFLRDIKPYIESLVVFADAWAKDKPCSSICEDLPPTFEGDLHIHPKV